MHLLRPSANALRTVAPPLGHAFNEGAINLKAATALNTQLAESSQALQEFGHNPIVTLGLEDFTQTLTDRQPAARRDRARAGRSATTSRSRSATSRASSPRTSASGTLARASFAARSHRPQQRGLPLVGARQRSVHRKRIGDQHQDHRQQPPAREPLPERRRARPAAACAKPATRPTCPAKPSVGNLPAQRRRRTTAKSPPANTNLFGEKYPPNDAQGARPRQSADQVEDEEQGEGEEQMKRPRCWRRRDEIAGRRAAALQPGPLPADRAARR